MAMSVPSRTEAIMPQPHEQKLQDVVNSWTSDSLRPRAAAAAAGQSSSPPSARPAPPPIDSFSTSLRLTCTSLRSVIDLSPARMADEGPTGESRFRAGLQAAFVRRNRRVPSRAALRRAGGPTKYRSGDIVAAMRIAAAALVLFVSIASPAPAQQRAHAPATFTILHFNDVYEITPIEAGHAGGLARVARFRAELKARDPTLLTTLGGDYVSPSALGTARVNADALRARP